MCGRCSASSCPICRTIWQIVLHDAGAFRARDSDHLPGHGIGTEGDLADLIAREHDEDMTAVAIHPLPPLPHRHPIPLNFYSPHTDGAITLKSTINANWFHRLEIASSNYYVWQRPGPPRPRLNSTSTPIKNPIHPTATNYHRPETSPDNSTRNNQPHRQPGQPVPDYYEYTG